MKWWQRFDLPLSFSGAWQSWRLSLAFAGCTGARPGPHANFWTQCVKTYAVGLTYVSPYGPMNFGALQWERNTACDKDLKRLPMPAVKVP